VIIPCRWKVFRSFSPFSSALNIPEIPNVSLHGFLCVCVLLVCVCSIRIRYLLGQCCISVIFFVYIHHATSLTESEVFSFNNLYQFLRMTSCNTCIISLNVRGVKNQRKRRSIFCFLKDQKCDFYLLQETYSKPQDELIWKAEWRGDIFFSHGSNHQKGVCILLSHAFLRNSNRSFL